MYEKVKIITQISMRKVCIIEDIKENVNEIFVNTANREKSVENFL